MCPILVEFDVNIRFQKGDIFNYKKFSHYLLKGNIDMNAAKDDLK